MLACEEEKSIFFTHPATHHPNSNSCSKKETLLKDDHISYFIIRYYITFTFLAIELAIERRGNFHTCTVQYVPFTLNSHHLSIVYHLELRILRIRPSRTVFSLFFNIFFFHWHGLARAGTTWSPTHKHPKNHLFHQHLPATSYHHPLTHHPPKTLFPPFHSSPTDPI